MNQVVATWNAYSNYNFSIPVYYNSGIPTAQANYMGSIGFGGQGNFRAAMHESSHWFGTGGVTQWDLHQRFSVWNGAYVSALRSAFDGPGERQFIYGVHYGPQGANYDSEGVQGDIMVHIIGAFRRDMNLDVGDQSIGVPSATYRLRNRVSMKLLDPLGATADGSGVAQWNAAATSVGVSSGPSCTTCRSCCRRQASSRKGGRWLRVRRIRTTMI